MSEDVDEVEYSFRQLHESVSHLCDVGRVGYIRPYMDTSCTQLLQQVVTIHNVCMAKIALSSDSQKSVEKKIFHMQQITTVLFDQFSQISLMNRNCSATTGSISSEEDLAER